MTDEFHVFSSVACPDLHVFGPLGSESIGQRYGSGSFNHLAKIVRKTLITTALRLFDFLSLKMMYKYLQKVTSKKTFLLN